MFKKILCGCSLAIALAVSVPATALPVTGEVIMFGAFNTDTGNLATATSIAFVGSGWTDGGTGSYAPINSVSRPVTFMDFTFSPSLSPSPLNPLWSFTYAGITYSFVMDSVDVGSPRSSSLLTLLGRGTLFVTGFDPTPGIWEFTSGETRSAFIKFTSESSALPEPGSLALLGLGLLGFGLARRRKT